MAKSRSYSGIITLLILLAAGGGGWYYWQSHREKGPEFYTAAVTHGEVVQTVTAAGTIKPLLDVLVSSQISGYITAWYADFNTKVKKGDLLATLLPTAYEASVKSAEGDLANSQANAQLQAVTLKRDQELLAKSLIAQSDYDTQAAQLAEAQAQVEIKTATLETARNNLSYCRIISPMDGMVISRNIDVGNSVAATLSSPTLFEIGNDLTQMQIDASVAEADVGNVAIGQEVDFTVDAYPNRPFRGEVYQVRNAPQTQQNVVIYDVMIKVPNADLKLKPGMTANVSVVITRHPGVLRVANGALRFRMPDGIAVNTLTEPATGKTGEQPAAESAPVVPAKSLSPDERRKAMQAIYQEAGFNFRSGPPSPDMLETLKKLAAAKGIELPERLLNGGGRAAAGASDAPVFRNIYRIAADAAPGTAPDLIRVRVGITDGAYTEVISSLLHDGDQVITGVNEPGPAGAAGGASPFGGGGGGGRGGPGGVGRF
jgi:HlyD family secretion protein